MYVNRAEIFGNLVRDPELRSTTTGQQVANFTLATNRRVKRDQDTQDYPEFHSIVAWGKLAEIAARLTKGQRVYVEGRLQTRSWEDQAGVKRQRTEIVADNIVLHALPKEAPQEAA